MRRAIIVAVCMMPHPLFVLSFALYVFCKSFIASARWATNVLSVELDQTVCPKNLKDRLIP